MIIVELFPFGCRALRARSFCRGFYIPVLELSQEDVDDVKEFAGNYVNELRPGAKSCSQAREVAKQIQRRRRKGSGERDTRGSTARSVSVTHQERELGPISSKRSSSRRIAPIQPLPAIPTVQNS